MQIRLAERADLPEIVAIYNAAIPARMATADTTAVSVEGRIDWFEQHPPDSRPLWVAEEAGRVIAWISLRDFYGRPAYRRAAELGLYVAPDAQSRGVGKSMLKHVMDAAPGLGLRRLLGFVFAHNHRSLGLLERFGFERWGLLPGVAELDGIERNLVILGRRVDQG